MNIAQQKMRDDTRELLGVTGCRSLRELRERAIMFPCQSSHADMLHGIVQAGDHWVSWCDAGTWSHDVHDTREEAAQTVMAGMKILYEDFHAERMERDGLSVVVGENRDGNGNLIGWSFSLDSDGLNHGFDECYGEY